MGDAREHDVVEVGQQGVEGLGLLGRALGQPRGDVAGLHVGENRQLADALHVVGDPVDHRVAVLTELVGVQLRPNIGDHYDGWDGSFGTRTPVLSTGRSGATLSGNVFSTRTGPAQKPGIVITTVLDPADACPDVFGLVTRLGCPAPKLTCSSSVLRGRPTRDILCGTKGPDRILGGPQADRLAGKGGADCLRGQGGRDVIRGGAGRDLIKGGAGNDRILARGGGRDTVICGAGRDVAIVDPSDRTRGCEIVRRRS